MSQETNKVGISIAVLIIVIILIIVGVFVFYKKPVNGPGDFEVAKYLELNQEEMNESQQKLFAQVKESLAVDSSDNDAILSLANLHYTMNKYQTSIEILNYLDQQRPNDTIILQNLATNYWDMKDYKNAEAMYFKILENNILWMEAYQQLGDLYRFNLLPANDKFPQTIEQARAADVTKQYEKPLLQKLAFYYRYAEDYDKAIELFEEYLEKYPDQDNIRKELEEIKELNKE